MTSRIERGWRRRQAMAIACGASPSLEALEAAEGVYATAGRLMLQFDAEAATDRAEIEAAAIRQDQTWERGRDQAQEAVRRYVRAKIRGAVLEVVRREVDTLDPANEIRRARRVRALLLAFPGRSDRWLAREAGTSAPTVGRARTALQDAGMLRLFDRRLDQRGRIQPCVTPGTPPKKPDLQANHQIGLSDVA